MAIFCNYMKLLPQLLTMICYDLFVKYLCCFVGFSKFIISASKFSRSPYLATATAASSSKAPAAK